MSHPVEDGNGRRILSDVEKHTGVADGIVDEDRNVGRSRLPPDPDAGLSEEERAEIDRKLLWRLDLKLIPWLCLLYLLSFLDRACLLFVLVEVLTRPRNQHRKCTARWTSGRCPSKCFRNTIQHRAIGILRFILSSRALDERATQTPPTKHISPNHYYPMGIWFRRAKDTAANRHRELS
jgi:hypothetical protein